jgi:membrane dipeptidase
MTIFCLNMPACAEKQPPEMINKAKDLHKRMPLIDGHNDLPWRYREKVDRALSKIDISQLQPELNTDIPRLRKGGVGGQFWSVYVSPDLKGQEFVRATMEQIDLIYNMISRYPGTFRLALTADQVEKVFQSGKIASLIAIEGGHSIGNSLAVLRMFYELGVRYMTLTHNRSITWADSATDVARANGLTRFGEEVVREMNRLGMIIDLSHVSPKTMHDALDVTEAPVIFSHSSSRVLIDHVRNVPDDVLKRLSINGGVIMVAFVPKFISKAAYENLLKREAERDRLKSLSGSSELSVEEGVKRWVETNPEPSASLNDIADHIDYIRSVVGVNHIGIGSDFDGSAAFPKGLEDVSKFPMLTAELIRRGYSDEDISKIIGGNILRVMRQVESVAQRLKKERGPSEAIIEELESSLTGNNLR